MTESFPSIRTGPPARGGRPGAGWRPAVLLAVALATAFSGCSVVGYPGGVPSPGEPAPADERSDPRVARDPGGGGGARVTPVAEPLSRYGNPRSYEVFGEEYHVLTTAEGYDEVGIASWYGDEFAGRPTSSGEVFDPILLTAAHRSLPLPTWVEVTNLANGRTVIVRVNDRGPFARTHERIIDLSEAAARRLDMIGAGTARVRIRALGPEELGGGPPR